MFLVRPPKGNDPDLTFGAVASIGTLFEQYDKAKPLSLFFDAEYLHVAEEMARTMMRFIEREHADGRQISGTR